MKNSKDLKDLIDDVEDKARLFIEMCEEDLIVDKIRVTSTLRDFEYQNFLYAQGRTRPGKIVTNAKAGYSWHNFGVAFDVVPIVDGKAIWDTTSQYGKQLWSDIGAIGEECGLEWAGRWNSFKEYAHFQDTDGLSLAELRKKYYDNR